MLSTTLADWIFVAVTAYIAYHGITFRDKEGKMDNVRLLFGCIALLFSFTVFAKDILGLW